MKSKSLMFGAIAAAVLAVTQTAVEAQTRARRGVLEGERHPETSHTISTVSQLVIVPVSVLDAKGAPVPGLPRERFRLFEDGVEQTILSFGQEDAPVSIGIVLDASRSMEPKMQMAREAIVRLFEGALPGDEFQLVEFNNSPRNICGLTQDKNELRDALRLVSARGWTAMFDGILLSAQLMKKAKNGRKALVVLSDGQDNFSRHHETELRAYLQEAGVVVFSIGLSAGTESGYNSRHLRRLSRETGGRFYPGKLDDLGETVRAIGDAIRSQYTLSYRPVGGNSDGKFRRIRVDVSGDGKSVIGVSWRGGYHNYSQ